MARVTREDVLSIIKTKTLDLDSFISSAELIVDEALLNEGYSESRLSKIESYVAAHLIALHDGEMSSESIGSASVSYVKQVTGDYFTSTKYGQTAIMLDTSGILRSYGDIASSFEVF